MGSRLAGLEEGHSKMESWAVPLVYRYPRPYSTLLRKVCVRMRVGVVGSLPRHAYKAVASPCGRRRRWTCGKVYVRVLSSIPTSCLVTCGSWFLRPLLLVKQTLHRKRALRGVCWTRAVIVWTS